MSEARQKTWKRELALTMLACVFALSFVAVAWNSDQALEAMRILSAPVFLFAAGAFGLDEVSKNMRRDR